MPSQYTARRHGCQKNIAGCLFLSQGPPSAPIQEVEDSVTALRGPATLRLIQPDTGPDFICPAICVILLAGWATGQI